MEVNVLDNSQSYSDFFQQRLKHLLTHWRDHEAVAELQIAVLDRERTVILKVISLGLDIKPFWCIVRPLIINMTPYMERRGHWEEWHGILERAISVAQQKNDTDHEVTLTALLARLCQRMSRPQDVVKHYRRVIRLARRTGNRFEEARACSNLGYYYIDSGRRWRSEVLSKHALEIFEELDSDHGRAHTHNHLGVLYTRQNMFDLAEKHLLEASKIWSKMGDQHGIMRAHGNLGRLYNEMEHPDKAIEHSNLALNYAEQTGEQSILGTLLINISVGHMKQMNIEKALQFADDAENILLKFSDKLQLAYIWHQRSLFHLKAIQLTEAAYFKEKALGIYQQFQLQSDEVRLQQEFDQAKRTK